MVTERHGIASRLIIKTLSKGELGRNIISRRFWKLSSDGSTMFGLACTSSQQDFIAMASDRPFSR